MNREPEIFTCKCGKVTVLTREEIARSYCKNTSINLKCSCGLVHNITVTNIDKDIEWVSVNK